MKVSLKDDRLPDGTELHVRSLGTLVNGKTVDISDEQAAAFEADRGLSLEQAFKNDSRISVSKSGKVAEEAKGGDD